MDSLIPVFEILSSSDIAQTNVMQKFPALYSTYMIGMSQRTGEGFNSEK